jgi:cysteinyl-tRNA synthetase
MLKIRNTLTGELEEFKSIKPNEVSLYVCGPTVYDLLHVGNFRGPVFFNLVRNWLQHKGFKVTMALNFTDVDDKILRRALNENRSAQEISEQYITEYKTDYASLKLKPHDLNPKVTEHLDSIRMVIASLIEKGFAYQADGDVVFAIKKFQEYGKLSGRNVDQLIAGARVEIDDKKQNPLDFVLWKAAKPGEVSWESPWGPGRPGWHIECSAMIYKIFGDQIDIHGGGSDLIFPHHENEIAQSECCTGKQFVRYWMHNAMLNFGGQKMSKSVGNLVTMRDFLKSHHPEIYKWMILSNHYRHEADFSEDGVKRAIKGLAKVYSALAVANFVVSEISAKQPELLQASKVNPKWQEYFGGLWKKIEEALDNDFGTPEVFAIVFEAVSFLNTGLKRASPKNADSLGKALAFQEFMNQLGSILALFLENPQDLLNELDSQLLREMNLERSKVDLLVQERAKARLAKDFKASDDLRSQLTAMGISVMDTELGSFWEVMK